MEFQEEGKGGNEGEMKIHPLFLPPLLKEGDDKYITSAVEYFKQGV